MPYVFEGSAGLGDLSGSPSDLQAEAATLNRLALEYGRNATRLREWATKACSEGQEAKELRARAEAFKQEAICADARSAMYRTFKGTDSETRGFLNQAVAARTAGQTLRQKANEFIATASAKANTVRSAFMRDITSFTTKATNARGRAAQLLAQADAAIRRASLRERYDYCVARANQAERDANELERITNEEASSSAREFFGPTDAQLATARQKIAQWRAEAAAFRAEAEQLRRQM